MIPFSGRSHSLTKLIIKSTIIRRPISCVLGTRQRAALCCIEPMFAFGSSLARGGCCTSRRARSQCAYACACACVCLPNWPPLKTKMKAARREMATGRRVRPEANGLHLDCSGYRAGSRAAASRSPDCCALECAATINCKNSMQVLICAQ